MNTRILIHIVVILTAITTLAACGQQSGNDAYYSEIIKSYPDLKSRPMETGFAERVIDGDTFVLQGGDRVRLVGVNAPEISGQGEAYGQDAKAFAAERLMNKKLYLFSDVGSTDRYGRLLRYVFIEGEPEMFNDQLLGGGYASIMTVPPNVMYAEHFLKLERQAREAGKGLWGINEQNTSDTPDTPAQSCADPQIKGNINSRNERIYHVPGSRSYEQTIAEMMFCTEKEAEQAGFRAPKR
ncbi:thermonuclease family protein [Paenibacillus abyssi]|uniref:Nuclease n=1 Tax=Paenibacillus abyssi TaxID=1340531 RepID=A0A917D8Q9_9BACL|nr:thermonuclease family protein [Paenibacillus abyssi]GGG13081.1 nuclease [Paenibacillus abyssi]